MCLSIFPSRGRQVRMLSSEGRTADADLRFRLVYKNMAFSGAFTYRVLLRVE
jgi:hypothetical protein